MKKILCILLVFPLFMNGQGWERTYGSIAYDYGESVEQTTDGGYIYCGRIVKFNNTTPLNSACLVKINQNGDTLWTNTYNDGLHLIGNSVKQTSDGGFIMCGTGYLNFSSGSRDIFLIKTDSLGNQQWKKPYGSIKPEFGKTVQQTTDGGYIVCGYSENINYNDDIFLLKTNSLGDTVWSNSFECKIVNERSEAIQTSDGGYAIIGTKRYSSTNTTDTDSTKIWLIKTNSQGDSIWSKEYGGNGFSKGFSFQQTTDGGYIISCSWSDTITSSSFTSEKCLIKTDSFGDTLWVQTFGNGFYDASAYSVQQTIDGGYVFTGSKNIPGLSKKVYLLKTDGFGNQQWSQTFGGNYEDIGLSVEQTTDGGFIICGQTKSFGNGQTDIYLIKTNNNGNITSTLNIPRPNSNRKIESTLDILGRETQPKSNTPFIEVYDDGSIEKKLIIE